MAETFKSIAEARKTLPALSKQSQSAMKRFVITNNGVPQSVLLGYEDYESLQAAAFVLQNPDAAASIREGLRQLDDGEGIPDHKADTEYLRESMRSSLRTFDEKFPDATPAQRKAVRNIMQSFERTLGIFGGVSPALPEARKKSRRTQFRPQPLSVDLD